MKPAPPQMTDDQRRNFEEALLAALLQALHRIERCSEQTIREIARCTNPEHAADLCAQLDRLDDGLILVQRMLDRSGSSHTI